MKNKLKSGDKEIKLLWKAYLKADMLKEDAKSRTADDCHPISTMYFMLIASIDMSPRAASLVAKGPVRVDVSTLKQFPIEQMGCFGKQSGFPKRCF